MDQALLLSFAELEEHHWWFVVRRRIVEDAIASSFTAHDASVLEVGCGTGGFARKLASQHPGWGVRGVEPSEQAARVAVDRGCCVDLGTFQSLPANDGSVDLLIALDVLEHCENDADAVAQAARVMKPGASFVLTVPALPSLWSSHDEDNRHYRRYTRETLAAAFGGSGLELERMTYFNSLLLPAGYLSRWVSRATGSKKALGVEMPSATVNNVMRTVFSAEASLLRHMDLPAGMSLLAVWHKPGGER